MMSSRIAACFFAAILALPSVVDAQSQSKLGGGNKSESISFVKDVAPIIEAKCGKCHVTSSKGEYNIKSYEALMNSDSVSKRKPDDSHFIEVIENGEMPKGGLKVTDDELETLKQWISAGAKFDGDDETDAISTGGGNTRGSRQQGGRARGGQSGSRTQGRRPSRSRNSRSSKPNAIETNKLMAFFDLDGDGKLSLKEIDAASRMLRSLDANEDDRITGDELGEF